MFYFDFSSSPKVRCKAANPHALRHTSRNCYGLCYQANSTRESEWSFAKCCATSQAGWRGSPSRSNNVENPLFAVVIATSVKHHYPLTKASLLAGKHSLIEKPMASSSRIERLPFTFRTVP